MSKQLSVAYTSNDKSRLLYLNFYYYFYCYFYCYFCYYCYYYVLLVLLPLPHHYTTTTTTTTTTYDLIYYDYVTTESETMMDTRARVMGEGIRGIPQSRRIIPFPYSPVGVLFHSIQDVLFRFLMHITRPVIHSLRILLLLRYN